MGHKRWAIAEGYIPGWSNGPEPQFTSHETACLLNVSDEEASVTITVYFSDREPAGPYQVIVPARRSRCTCASTTSKTPSPYRSTLTTRASSSRTCP